MDGPPPPPPPHGENPHTTDGEYRKSSDLPPGNYDIFIVPPHSSGGGFLYLPSLQCQRNSFIAGAASMLLVVLVWSAIAPIVRTWYTATAPNGVNGMGIVVMAIGVGVAGWAFGMSQSSKGNNGGGNRRFGGGFSGGSNEQNANSQSSGTKPNNGNEHGQRQHGNNGGSGPQHGGNFGGGPNRGNQYAGNQHDAGAPPKTDQNNHGPNGAEWERAREETKRKEELRRKMEEFKRKREAEAKEKERKREREAMEKELKERREQLEREMAAAREKAEREAREKAEKEAAEAREKQEKEAREAREREEKAAAAAKAEAERLAAEAKEKAAKEAAEKEAAAKAAAQKEAMAKFAALKEAAAKRYAEKKAQDAKKEAANKPPASAASATGSPRTPSPKKPPFPTAKTTVEEDDAYSFRPYDRPRRPYGQPSGSSAYSESSYAPSQSTARTTPPPSHRSSYSTKDPDKIVIQGVYQFNNAFMKTPVAQLVSGQGMVTDGLVLRITTEGLFIDDDLRGVGQREWDVKAWTLKLAEVWCPQMGPDKSSKPGSTNPFSFRRGNSAHSVPTSEESDAFVINLLKVCKNTCRLASPSACFARGSAASGVDGGPVHPPQGDSRGLHILRASLRDQEGKRYVFVLQDTEAWKVAIGLQRLRSGALVRALGVSALPSTECKSILGGLGYT
ncbi:hypothetical protein N7462_007230 [Penicillium macrosclerotiorum]|uniref:uncharacterized protein n=1 Tax=Penicillium macrosclerotiorum TaxID=303699 RepID=UPI0025466BB1|nr:uncharacterized protein N7462_007230 [Penicillium macrosclerotiorum]KAJ5678986.1 hypothetical protein N7462_007230 [Penicillium macrosclerotiorum]